MEENIVLVKKYLKLEEFELKSVEIIENIKELCVARLCREIGITFRYDYKSEYFRLFSNVVGEAVCRVLDIKVTVGSPVVRLVRYNGVNLVDKACELLKTESLEEAFVDLYNITEEFKKIVPKL